MSAAVDCVNIPELFIRRHNSIANRLTRRHDEQGFTLYKAYGEDAEYTKEEEHTEETGYTVISADNLKQMNRFDGEDMENER